MDVNSNLHISKLKGEYRNLLSRGSISSIKLGSLRSIKVTSEVPRKKSSLDGSEEIEEEVSDEEIKKMQLTRYNTSATTTTTVSAGSDILEGEGVDCKHNRKLSEFRSSVS